MVYKIRATALILVVFLTPQSVPGQTPAPPAAKPAAVGLIKLTGDDEKRRDELGKAIDAAVEADRWDEAIAKAQDSVGARCEGPGSETLRDRGRRVVLEGPAPNRANAEGGS